ncbi:MAG TPA: 6-pyruvoyl-tetrahydropterin synthase-related protein [Blastocatellia bacterium]|nr:6-pyruvoyl-tetrahydropterin synthase-related protein [Blastocatellia bacterium]
MRRWVGVGVHVACLLVIGLAVTYLYRELLQTRAFLSHEVYYTYIRAHEVALELLAGHLPQAFPDAIFGAGFAFPRFYPPFTLWLSAGLSLLVGNTCLGVNLTFFLSVVLSGFTMYFAAVVLGRDRLIALAASLLYVSMPYRFVDVFVRGGLAEGRSFVWYPLVIAGLWRAYTRRTLPWYLPVAVGLLLVSHNITALYFLAFCTLLCMAAFVGKGIRGVAMPVLGIALGCGLAVWFLLPQQYYMKSVLVSDPAYMWADDLHVQEHRVMPWQFFYSLPNAWYGESNDPSYADAMSFELGAGQLALPPVALTFLVAMRRRRLLRTRPFGVFSAVVLAGYVGCLAFMVWPISFLVVLPKQFAYIQFPWRMLAITAFMSVLALVVTARCARLRRRSVILLAAASVAIVLLVPGFERKAQTHEGFTDATVLDAEYVREEGRTGYTVLTEYLPRDFDTRAYGSGTLDPDALERPHFIDRSDGDVVAWSRVGLDLDIEVDARRDATLMVPLVYYDFYRATTATGADLPIRSVQGLCSVDVPAGATRIAIRQVVTPIGRLALAASAMTAIVTALCAYWFRRPAALLRPARRVSGSSSSKKRDTVVDD